MMEPTDPEVRRLLIAIHYRPPTENPRYWLAVIAERLERLRHMTAIVAVIDYVDRRLASYEQRWLDSVAAKAPRDRPARRSRTVLDGE